MLRLNRMTDYGLVVLSQMARERNAVSTAPDLAEATGVPLPSVSKILKVLSHHRLVVSLRGVHGGYALARSPERISAAEVIAVLEGQVELTACVDGVEGLCKVELSCPLRGHWDPVNSAIRRALQEISLAELAMSGHFAPRISPDKAPANRAVEGGGPVGY